MAIAVAILVMPLVLALGARVFSFLHQPSERTGVWLRFLVFSRLIMATAIAAWWAIWDSNLLAEVRVSIDAHFADWFTPPLTEWLLFFIPPIVGLGLYLIFVNIISAVVLELRLTLIDLWRRVWG